MVAAGIMCQIYSMKGSFFFFLWGKMSKMKIKKGEEKKQKTKTTPPPPVKKAD